MLHDFVMANRREIMRRTSDRVESRAPHPTAPDALGHGVPMFLTQLSETLRLETTAEPFASGTIGSTAARHGASLRSLGFSVSQVVHEYGDVCQTITELAIEQKSPITTQEFHTLNRCLDTAIAEAVTEHTRVTAAQISSAETERLGHAAHELRDVLNTAMLAFKAMQSRTITSDGSTGAMLGRSLRRLGRVVDDTLAEVRLGVIKHFHQPVQACAFVEELAVAARLHAHERGVQFTIEPIDPELIIDVDAPLLTSAAMNLLHNAFKNTPAGGRVVLRTLREGTRVLMEIEDECGGLPPTNGDPFRPFGDRRGRDRTGLGLGLSIARNAVRAHEGDIHVRNLPGKGCVFTIDIPVPGGASAGGSTAS